MRRELFALLLISAAAFAALDQAYTQEVSRGGESVVGKSMELAVFSNQLTPGALERMEDACARDSKLGCSVDKENKLVTIRQSLGPGTYYTYSAEYGFPSVTYTLVVEKLPADIFSDALAEVLAAANATGVAQVRGTVKPLSLSDKDANAANAAVLKALGASIKYRAIMPSGVTYAAAGSVEGAISGNEAEFEIIDVMADSEPLVVKSEELNLGLITLIAMVVVLGALAFSFLGSRKPAKKRRK